MSDVEQKVIDNQKLVYRTVQKHFPGLIRDDDVIQEGMIGLWNAVNQFDESKGFTFSTFASTVIYNNIAMYLRKENRYREHVSVSIEEPGVCDVISTRNVDYVQYVDLDGWICALPVKFQQIVRLRLQGNTQDEIAKRLGCTRQNVQYILSRCRPSFDTYI